MTQDHSSRSESTQGPLSAIRPARPRSILAFALLAVPALALAGCAGDPSGSGYETHEVPEWKALYESTPGAFLLDVRTLPEYQEAHLANATLIPYTDLPAQASDLPADKSTPIFVYCRSGNRSAIASDTLVEMGYTNVHNMAGGIGDWMAAGYPVTQ